MFECTTADLGPDFIGWAGVVDGRAVAIMTPRALDDVIIGAQVAELLSRAGFDCSSCLECPLGLPTQEA